MERWHDEIVYYEKMNFWPYLDCHINLYLMWNNCMCFPTEISLLSLTSFLLSSIFTKWKWPTSTLANNRFHYLCNKGDPILFYSELLILSCVDWLESISWHGRLTQICTVVPKQTRGKETWFFRTKETQKFAISAPARKPTDATDSHSRQLIVLIVCNVEMISIWLVFSCSCESSNFYTP